MIHSSSIIEQSEAESIDDWEYRDISSSKPLQNDCGRTSYRRPHLPPHYDPLYPLTLNAPSNINIYSIVKNSSDHSFKSPPKSHKSASIPDYILRFMQHIINDKPKKTSTGYAERQNAITQLSVEN